MKIVQELPPNYEEISKKFGFANIPAGTFNPIFAYGDIIYNPTGTSIPEDIIIHEQVHQGQQANVGGPKKWWEFYLESPAFRLEQEVEAYREQYKWICQNYSRHARRAYLQKLAKDLSSALYGNLISKKEAEELIENY